MSEYPLPQRVYELADLIGMDATLILMAKYGGLVLDIPRNAHRAERLKALMPYNAVEALCGYWGGDRFYVPKMDSAARQWRDTEIRRLQPSHSTAELALRFKLSYRAIEKIMAKTEPEVEIQPPTELQLTLQLH
jgi:Mor family transcriptional regulator